MNFELSFLVFVAAVSAAAAGSVHGGVGIGKRSGE